MSHWSTVQIQAPQKSIFIFLLSLKMFFRLTRLGLVALDLSNHCVWASSDCMVTLADQCNIVASIHCTYTITHSPSHYPHACGYLIKSDGAQETTTISSLAFICKQQYSHTQSTACIVIPGCPGAFCEFVCVHCTRELCWRATTWLW